MLKEKIADFGGKAKTIVKENKEKIVAVGIGIGVTTAGLGLLGLLLNKFDACNFNEDEIEAVEEDEIEEVSEAEVKEN